MTAGDELVHLLSATFPTRNVKAALGHFQASVGEFQQGAWESAIAKAGKFLEAVLKCICGNANIPVPTGRRFKADQLLVALEQIPRGTVDDTIRLTLPRACRFGYDISSNRGGRHDPDEVDPNQMDATVIVGLSSWVLAEMVRFSQKGAVDPDRAAQMVGRLIAPRYPLIENVDGRVYFHGSKKTARAIALVVLLFAYPGRVNREELVSAIRRHNMTDNAARVAITRLKGVVDEDADGNLQLLAPGRKEAEELLGGGDS